MRVANVSPGSSSTGSRLMVASAAPVTMLVAPARPRCARERPEPVALPRVPGGDVDHRLLVARGMKRSASRLVKGLADPGDVAVAEDSETTGKERCALDVAFDFLHAQEAHQRLGDCKPAHTRHSLPSSLHTL